MLSWGNTAFCIHETETEKSPGKKIQRWVGTQGVW